MINQQIEASPAPDAEHGEPHRSATKLGQYLEAKSVNKALVARKTGLNKQRMSELTLNVDSKLRAHEVYLIALAIGVPPVELFAYVCSEITLKD